MLPTPDRFTDLTLRLLRDDGALVFLNGQEIVRSNLPDGVITSTTTALSTVGDEDENTFFPFTIDPADLVEGLNVLAVEIHQRNDSSSDISFDLELVATEAGTNPAAGLTLQPGINRVVAQSFNGPAGTGQLLDSAHVDIWYDNGVTQSVGGAINVDTTFTLANSPYVVTSDLVIEGDATLTIEPGVTVFFENGTGLEVTGTGRVVAEGTESQRIHFGNNPSTSSSWEGVRVVDTQSDNRFSYIDFVAGADQGEALYVERGRAIFDNVSWSGSERQVIDLVHPNLIVSNSIIPGISGGETIHMSGYEPGDYLEFDGNVIGINTSGGDVVDVAHNSLTPPPIYFRNNVFLGGFDDGIDTDGNYVIIENNVFQNFHDNTSRQTTSNAVSTGFETVDGQRVSSRLELRNNIFFDNDHHLLLKDFSSAILENNTLVDATVAAISLSEPDGSSVVGPGSSITLDGNIVFGFPEFFESRLAETEVVINRSIVPTELHSEGVGNIDADPLFVDSFNRDYRLRLGSPALGTGPSGTNIGALQNQPASLENLVITEINYHPHDPQTTAEQAFDADEFEFIELINTNPDSSLDLQGAQISGGVSFTFGNVVLAPGERVVVVESVGAFETRYGTSMNVAGSWSGGLSNSGEELVLLDRDGNELSSIDYGDSDPWSVAADGAGATLVLIDPLNTPTDQLGKYYRWRASVAEGGTPGIADVAPAGIVINEVLANPSGQQTDAIELFNPTNSNVDVGGWYLSDSKNDLFKFRIPVGTMLAAGEYLVFNESDFNPTPASPAAGDFALNGSEGEEVYLTRPDEDGNPEFVDAVGFGGSFDGQTIGRVPDGAGRLTPLAANTLGESNSDPSFGPLLISEVHYHPADPTAAELAIEPALTTSDFEFVEIHNPSSATVDLTDWRLRGEADFDFAMGAMLEADETLIVISFDPADSLNQGRLNAFVNRFGLTTATVASGLVGGYTGRLNNSFGRVELQQPDAAPSDDPTFIPHVTADEVLYDDLAPWPVAADGDGSSLNRTAATAYGNAASSWEAATPSPGEVVVAAAVPHVVSVTRDEGGVLARPDLLSTISFSFDVGVNVSVDDLEIRNDTLGGSLVDTTGLIFDYDALTNTATWDFGNLTLDYAFYSFELSDDIVSVAGGLSLDGDADGSPGVGYIEPVYVSLPGDANLDGQVDVLGDAFLLVGNLGTTGGATWAQGDFNGDGNVNVLGDAFILVGNLGQSVVPPVAASALASESGLSASSAKIEVDAAEPVVVSRDDSFASFAADKRDDQQRSKQRASVQELALAGSQNLDDVFADEFWI